jgi:cytoskeletal protein RodZ
MTRTDGVASSRPRTAGTASISQATSPSFGGPRRSRRITRRGLLALPAALALIVPAAPALAQGGTSSTQTSGYSQKPPAPKTEPKKATEPSKEATTPAATTSPTSTAPTTTAASSKASTLPFTGLNLTWIVAAGAILLAAGLAIRVVGRPRAGR